MVDTSFINDDQLRSMLIREIKTGKFKSRSALARHLGVSQAFLSQYLDRVRPHASEKILKRLGLETIRYYRSR